MPTTSSRYPLPESASALARRTTLGTGVAVVAVLAAQVVVDAVALDVGGSGSMSPFSAGPLVATTVVAGAGAAVVYAALVRFTERPTRNFVVAAGVAFTLQLLPVALIAPSIDVTSTGQAVLVVYHVLVAVPIVAFVTGFVPR